MAASKSGNYRYRDSLTGKYIPEKRVPSLPPSRVERERQPKKK